MSAELVDPFATHQPNLEPEEWVAIRDEIWDRPWDDPARFPDLLKEAVKTLGEIATGNSPNPVRTATRSLREMCYRAHNGAWRSEIEAEPSWSVDPEERWPHHEVRVRRVDDVVENI